MSGGIYLIQDGGGLVKMTEKEYDSESLLQGLLAQYSDLLAGDQINDTEPRRWLFIAREVPVPFEEGATGSLALDHLFLDQDAVPTLVEVKRSTDTRIRREVVAQMLDYAANAVAYWPVEEIRALFDKTCTAIERDPEQELADFLGPEADTEDFWQKAKTNLQAGRVRLLFVADLIPPELRRIVEFLNEQMDPAEVLAVEIKQYVGGQGLKALVPRVIGQTGEPPRPPTSQAWDEQSFFRDLMAGTAADTADAEAARQILGWARQHHTRVVYRKGRRDATASAYVDLADRPLRLISIYSPMGLVELPLQTITRRAPFSEEPKREELRRRLNEVQGVQLPDEALDKYPTIKLSVLTNKDAMDEFLRVFAWVVEEVMAS